MKPGDLVRVVSNSFRDYHELYGNDESPVEFLEEEGYDILITTFIRVYPDELCTVLKIGELEPNSNHKWIHVLKNTGETGWITNNWLESLT